MFCAHRSSISLIDKAFGPMEDSLLTSAETAMGKPLFKASDGGRFDILREGEDSTQCELRQGSGT